MIMPPAGAVHIFEPHLTGPDILAVVPPPKVTTGRSDPGFGFAASALASDEKLASGTVFVGSSELAHAMSASAADEKTPARISLRANMFDSYGSRSVC
jgi:hypothetical protein